jgi:hypothetical protein
VFEEGGRSAAEYAVDHGHEKQSGDGCQQQAADHGAAERSVLLAAFAEAERHRQHAHDHGQRRHNHRTQARVAGFERGGNRVGARLALIVGEVDQQNAVGGGHADTHDGAHQGWHVDGGLGDEEHQQDAGKRAGQRHQDDERVKPGLEVHHHDEIHQDHREHQADTQADEG